MLDLRAHLPGARAAARSRRSARAWPSEVAIVWAIVLALAAASLMTYWRLPAGATYHFADTGPGGGLSRVVSYLSYPVALIAIAVAGLAAVSPTASRRLRIAAVAAVALSASAPFVVSQSDLTARWGDALPVAGVLLAAVVSAAARRRAPETASRGDRVRVALVVLLAVVAIPWMAAALGFYISDAPVLGSFVRARQPTPGNALLPTIHRGLHDGLFGCQLAATALLLSRPLRRIDPGRLRTALSCYLGLMLVYGIAIAAADAWDEQLVKRGATAVKLPDVLNPSLSLAWLCVLLAAVAVHVGWFGRERDG